MKIERLLGIIFYLLNRTNVTANQLAEYFEVSKRTIIRDIDTLTLAGVPIYSEQGVKGGYTINKDFRLNEKIMDNANSEYILLALQSLKSVYGNKKVVETYEKVKHIYSEKSNMTLPQIDFSVANENESVIEYLSILKKAVCDNKTVCFEYTNSNSDTRIVYLNPLHIYYKWYSWYIFGYDINKQDFRLFKVVRMQNINIGDETFKNNYNVVQLLNDYEMKRSQQNIYVTIRYQKNINTLINEYFKGDIVSESEHYIMRIIKIKENDFITFSIILGFLDKIEIVSPYSYKQRLENHLRKAIEKLKENGDI